ncbi:helix-turn-helix transcriptional regulator [Tropicimonas sp. TH_r6]|uniref:helix-turn-helix domain-containing protein n=1 Tax=Tropicimonas sp. TH_r6 TaxID=3082085 RepID=UPI002953D8FE|nr:helix-turn-helix transcriptional regulator [Tropicimonas sp. TH_r6]MDV7145635.1 helix-turn-helix transcriptional regulator [Tropicimonas sp. TH_r6]
MTINPTTLKLLRNNQDLSQEVLAKRSTVSQRQINRIESGKTKKPNRHTVERLANALDVAPDLLGKQLSDLSDVDWKRSGFTTQKVRLNEEVSRNYRIVAHHYGVTFHDLVDATPWLFTLVAEMSLAERRRRLEASDEAFEAAFETLPTHWPTVINDQDYYTACDAEERSIRMRDIFGELEGVGNENPFVEFLRENARTLRSEGIPSDDLTAQYGPHLPRWTLFRGWLEKLALGGASEEPPVASKVECLDMPKEARDNPAERTAWIANKILPAIGERPLKRAWETSLDDLAAPLEGKVPGEGA